MTLKILAMDALFNSVASLADLAVLMTPNLRIAKSGDATDSPTPVT